MAWKVEISQTAERQIGKLDRPVQRRIIDFLRSRIATDENPRRIGKALQGDRGELWRYRVGDYRLICQIDDEVMIVLLLAVSHRSRIYRR